jgi:hypothetical protein
MPLDSPSAGSPAPKSTASPTSPSGAAPQDSASDSDYHKMVAEAEQALKELDELDALDPPQA